MVPHLNHHKSIAYLHLALINGLLDILQVFGHHLVDFPPVEIIQYHTYVVMHLASMHLHCTRAIFKDYFVLIPEPLDGVVNHRGQ